MVSHRVAGECSRKGERREKRRGKERESEEAKNKAKVSFPPLLGAAAQPRGGGLGDAERARTRATRAPCSSRGWEREYSREGGGFRKVEKKNKKK
jgi:hypothetical protein